VGQPAVGAAVEPGALAHCLHASPSAGVTDFVELGPGAVLTGMAKRTVPDARTISVATPDDLDKLLEWVGAGSTNVPTSASTRASTSSPPNASSSARRPGSSPRRGDRHEGCRSPSATCSATSASRGPLAVRRRSIMGWLAVDGERVTPASPSPGCARG
jgi:[acyl-carrier-protein] S-malonyltransferase